MADKSFFSNQGAIKLSKIIEITKARACNNVEDVCINDVSPLDTAVEGEISVFNNKKYLNELESTKATACFIEEKYINHANKNLILLISDNPYKAYALTSSLFYPEKNVSGSISSRAIIDDYANLGENCKIAANVIIEAGVKIGDNTVIESGTYIGKNVNIGSNCKIYNNVTISHSIIGNDTIINAGSVIGKAGFGFATDSLGHHQIPQLGRTIIGNNVSIGSNSCIDRGSGNDTIISDYCMIDNLVQIGHNVVLGKGCVIVAMVGIAGSTKLGDFVVVGGQVGIAGHLNIGSYSQIAAGSGVIKDIKQQQLYGGYPAINIREWHKQSIILKKLVNKKVDKE